MIGKLISIRNVTERYDEVVLKEVESDALLTCTVEKGSCDHYISKYISIYTATTLLANANKDHVYPEGTIGWEKKGM